ncbi:hypothetical protein MRX96_027565 [Rhipicephalus microplus]
MVCSGRENNEQSSPEVSESTGTFSEPPPEAAEEEPSAVLSTSQRQRNATKRRRCTASSEFRRALLAEKKRTRESFEVSHAKEMELRKRNLKLPEKMVDAIERKEDKSRGSGLGMTTVLLSMAVIILVATSIGVVIILASSKHNS